MAIDWDRQLEIYNKDNGTDLQSVDAMLSHCYEESERSLHRCAERLQISAFTIGKKMKALGLSRQNRFGNSDDTARNAILKAGITKAQAEYMTLRELADITGKTRSAVWNALKAFAWEWKRVRQ